MIITKILINTSILKMQQWQCANPSIKLEILVNLWFENLIERELNLFSIQKLDFEFAENSINCLELFKNNNFLKNKLNPLIKLTKEIF